MHNPQDVNDGKIIMGLSHFLPGGGCQMNANHVEGKLFRAMPGIGSP
jgi:hypothetical protein